jgi:CheY-like chemotaxis protein
LSETDLLQSGAPRDQRVTDKVQSYSPPSRNLVKHSALETLQDKRLLLIDDNADVGTFVSTVARLEGASLVLAATGEDGLKALQQKPCVDLVLLDLSLPGIQGWDVLDEINRQQESERPPVVVFSAYADGTSRERATAMGAIGFISKPVGARDLVEQLKAFLSH